MEFAKPVVNVLTTSLPASDTAVVAASDAVKARFKSRHTLEITAKDATVYFGNADVTSDNGRPIASGESLRLPVNIDSTEEFYVLGGACIITEYF